MNLKLVEIKPLFGLYIHMSQSPVFFSKGWFIAGVLWTESKS